MGKDSKGFCGCMPFKVLAIIALVIEILAFAATIFYTKWFMMALSIPKIICLICALTCCKDQGCPRCGSAVLMFVCSGLELIWIIIMIAGREAWAWGICLVKVGTENYCDIYDNEDFDSCFDQCEEDEANRILIIYLLLTIVIALHITVGIGMC